jgi:MFS family permease
VRKAFDQPGFPALFAGVTTSMFGDSVMLLVFSMWVKELTGSSAQAGFTFFWLVLPSLLGPLLGGFIDRVARKALVVWANVASAVVLLPLLFVEDADHVWVIWAVTFLYGVSFVVVPAGLNGLLKQMLPEDRLVEANAAIQTAKESFRLFGPIIGASLFAFVGGWAVAVVDMVSFLVAALLVSRVRAPKETPEAERAAGAWKRDLTVGAGHLVRDDLLRNVLVALAATILVLGFAESSVYAVLDAFGRPVEFVSYLVTLQGVGAIVGGLLATRIIRRLGESGAVAAGLGILASALAATAAAPSIWVVLVAGVPLGLALPLITVGYMTLVQRRTPQAVMGRVSATLSVVFGLPQAISLAVGAALVAVLSYRTLFGVMAAVAFASGLYLAATVRASLRPGTASGGSPRRRPLGTGAGPAPQDSKECSASGKAPDSTSAA